jgi:hypothetical protein
VVALTAWACSGEPPLEPAQSQLVGSWEAELPLDIDRRLQQLAPQDVGGMRALIEGFGYAYQFHPDGTAERYVAGLGAEGSQSFRWRPLRETEERFEVELVDRAGSVQRTEFERVEAGLLIERGRDPERRLRRQ